MLYNIGLISVICQHELAIGVHMSGLPGGSVVKNLVCSAEVAGDAGSIPVGKIPWRRAWQPAPVFLSGESHGQRSLVGYSPQGRKESDMTEAT